MPNLTELAAAQSATIAALTGDAEADRHLQGIGLYPGGRITVARASTNGQPLLIAVQGAQFMIEREIAELIFVEHED